MHWADLAAEQLVSKKDKNKYTCASGITPSGIVHIGNFREVITTDLVARALVARGKKVKFIYSWDDYDVFRKIPADMPQQEVLQKYLRQPIVDIPDVYGCHASYAEHNEKIFEKDLPFVGIKPKFLYQSKKYRASEYAALIKKALDKRKIIADILNKYREEPLEADWYPVSVFCSQCNKDTTKIRGYEEFSVSYTCECGFQETFDIRKKGIIKLSWRADWPFRWYYEKVDFEPGGKDHSTEGGSYTTGALIIKEIFRKDPPQYVMYDFISVKGRGGKISSSKGDVVTLQDVLEIYEPAIARWLFASTRPNTEFAISFDLDVINLYEEFDKCERIYFGKEKTELSHDLLEKEKRIYELSCVKEIPKDLPLQVGFRHLTTLVQVYEGNINKVLNEFKNQIKTSQDKKRLKTRIQCVLNWLKDYAPEEFKFKINTKAPELKLQENQKKAIEQVITILKKDLDDVVLHQEFYKIMQENKIDMKDFFKFFYQLLINKDRGPKLANFILIIGKRRVSKILQEALNH